MCEEEKYLLISTDDDEGELEDRAQAERHRDKAWIRELEERLANVERQNKGKGWGK